MALRQTANELVLIDVFKEKAIGEAMDITTVFHLWDRCHCMPVIIPTLKTVMFIVVTAGANRKPGETRLDLAKKNVMIAKKYSKHHEVLQPWCNTCSIQSC